MEAPEKIWVHVNGRTADQNWESFGEYLAHGSQTNKSEYVEYTRSDRRLSAELVERVRAEANDKSMMLNAMERRQRELLRDILREVEGE